MTEPDREYAIDPGRKRYLRNLNMWLGVIAALVLAYFADCLELLWRADHAWAVVLAFPVGHLMLGFAMAFNKLSLRYGWYGMIGSFQLLYRPYGGETMVFYGLIAFSEEIIFRAVPLAVVGDSFWHIAGFAAVFSLQHLLSKRKRPFTLMLIDFWLFGLVLGGLFVWLGDLWPLVIIHWVRNASLAKLYVNKKQNADQSAP